MNKQEFGYRLKIIRGAEQVQNVLNIKNPASQQQFADALGSTQGYLSKVEKGEVMPGSEFLDLLRTSFNVNLNWLFGNPNEPIFAESTDAGQIVLQNELSVKCSHCGKSNPGIMTLHFLHHPE